MWINIEKQLPKRSGDYAVYGKGMIGGSDCQFTAYWDINLGAFFDKDGEDLTGIDQSIQYWFDFEQVANPVHRNNKIKYMEFQRLLVEKLRSNEKFAYEEASIYTVLLDLVEGNGLDEVLMMLHNLASDLGLREALEAQFKDAVKWEWSE